MNLITHTSPTYSQAISDSLLVSRIVNGIAKSNEFIVEFDLDDEDGYKRKVCSDIIEGWAVRAEIEITQDSNKEISGCYVHGIEMHDEDSIEKSLNEVQIEHISKAIRNLNTPW